MTQVGNQAAYWDTVGATKTFTHPVNPEWMAEVDRGARILDYGCGYGRTMAELGELGFTSVSGVDLSATVIDRGRSLRPDLRFDVLRNPPATGFPDGSFEVAVVFAVLTCVPDEAARRALVAELARVLAPGGLLYVSDMLLQDDDRNRERYEAYQRQHDAPYGVFDTGDGAVCRHHDLAELRRLLGAFDIVAERGLDITTMNGHASRGIQLLARKPRGGSSDVARR